VSWEFMIVPLPEKEEALIKAAQLGNNEAFQTLVISYESTVLGFIYRLGVDADSTQDMAQNTFIKAWLALETYNHRQKFKSWLLKIAYHTTIDFWRRQRPSTNLEMVTVQDTNIDVEKQVSANQQAEIVKEAIQSLPEQSRAALILREYHQYSYQEIAQTLDIPVGTVMSRLNYARSTLKKRLQPLLEKIDA
jgi:RNA polymerase sigma-70 factor, ECF subfamily